MNEMIETEGVQSAGDKIKMGRQRFKGEERFTKQKKKKSAKKEG